tara:strand:+ start:436 stop:786 length:351 start_codon:yes stop_codon:yes gene_type:complete
MMSDYNWCHNPDCHTYHTQDRIRGVKGNKVLRTRKIRVGEPNAWWQGWENHFCRVACFFEFVKKHITQIVAIAPVHEPSETPIDVQVVHHPERTTDYGWTRRAWTEKKIVAKNNQE